MGATGFSAVSGSADPYTWIRDPDPGDQLIIDPARSGSYLDIFVAFEKIMLLNRELFSEEFF